MYCLLNVIGNKERINNRRYMSGVFNFGMFGNWYLRILVDNIKIILFGEIGI